MLTVPSHGQGKDTKLLDPAGNNSWHFHSYTFGEKLGIWPHIPGKETGNYSVTKCQEVEENSDMDEILLSLLNKA